MRVRHNNVIMTGEVARVPRYAIESVQKFGDLCQLSLSGEMIGVELGRAAGGEGISQR